MNAIKFSPEGGKIQIKAEFDKQKENQMLISVSDTGTGMTDEVKQSLFTLFRNITQRTIQNQNSQGNTSGIGLGLTFCKSVIEVFGGEIYFDSVLNEGTTFYIRFPVKVTTQNEIQSKDQQVGCKSTESVLIEKLQRLRLRAAKHAESLKR